MSQKPSIGRVVIVRGKADGGLPGPSGEPFEAPALITKVHSDDCINVRILLDNSSSVPPLSSVSHSSLPEGNGQSYWWDWPARV